MRWNWTQADWPDFRFDAAAVEAFERQALLGAVMDTGARLIALPGLMLGLPGTMR